MGGFALRIKRFIIALLLVCLAASAVPAFRLPAKASPRYVIAVDITNQIVTVMDADDISATGVERQMICSTGKSSTPTPTGIFTLPAKQRASERTEWYYFPAYKCYAKWATRIRGGILFHSVIFNSNRQGPTAASVRALGSKASHGCVRLRVDDAKWIAQNCPAGTKCRIYYSGKVNTKLRKLLLKRSFSRREQTYDDFLAGRAPGETAELRLGSSGELVQRMQARLKALGFLDAEADGQFGATTRTAVKRFQKACGLKTTGTVSEALYARMFEDTAPTGTYVTLSIGSQGPAVAALQKALNDLKLWAGDPDEEYDETTADAVSLYQDYYGLKVNGIAKPSVQKKILARAAEVREEFGDDPYDLTVTITKTRLARVKKAAGDVTLYAKPRTASDALAQVPWGTTMEVLKTTSKWVKVTYGVLTGYILRKYVKLYTNREVSVVYAPVVNPTPTPMPTVFIPAMAATPRPATPAPTAVPTPIATRPPLTPPPAATPEPTAEPTPEPTPLPKYAVVKRDGARLYEEAKADERRVVAALNAGEALDVTGIDGDWIAVRYDGAMAWLPADDAVLTDVKPDPTPAPTEAPTPEPTEEPTPEPTEEPTPEPTEEPTSEPTEEPTPEPTEEPTPEPTEEPEPVVETIEETMPEPTEDEAA